MAKLCLTAKRPLPAATTLCALHYLACSGSIWVTQTFGGVKKVKLPFPGKIHSACQLQALAFPATWTLTAIVLCADLVLFTCVANASIVSLNLSLMLNPVGFYQVRRRRKPFMLDSQGFHTAITCSLS